MLRVLLWFVLIFIVWKISRLFTSYAGRSKYTDDSLPPFSQIQDAEFEDLSEKPPSEDPPGPKNDS